MEGLTVTGVTCVTNGKCHACHAPRHRDRKRYKEGVPPRFGAPRCHPCHAGLSFDRAGKTLKVQILSSRNGVRAVEGPVDNGSPRSTSAVRSLDLISQRRAHRFSLGGRHLAKRADFLINHVFDLGWRVVNAKDIRIHLAPFLGRHLGFTHRRGGHECRSPAGVFEARGMDRDGTKQHGCTCRHSHQHDRAPNAFDATTYARMVDQT
jgi:hypothetical protein